MTNSVGDDVEVEKKAYDACLELKVDLEEKANYTQVCEILTDFHSPVEGGVWEADKEYTDYQWWLAREDGKGWQLATYGY